MTTLVRFSVSKKNPDFHFHRQLVIMKKGTQCLRGQTSLSESDLEFLGLSPSPQTPPQPSICSFRDLPKRYEETLSRHRIRLTRKAFPLKSKLAHKLTEKAEEASRKHDNPTHESDFQYKHYNKPMLPSKHRPETPFQRFCRKNEDKLLKRNNTLRDGKPKCFFQPDIVKISPEKKVSQKLCKDKGFSSCTCPCTSTEL